MANTKPHSWRNTGLITAGRRHRRKGEYVKITREDVETGMVEYLKKGGRITRLEPTWERDKDKGKPADYANDFLHGAQHSGEAVMLAGGY